VQGALGQLDRVEPALPAAVRLGEMVRGHYRRRVIVTQDRSHVADHHYAVRDNALWARGGEQVALHPEQGCRCVLCGLPDGTVGCVAMVARDP
jgi:hypothetical protein